MGLNNNKYQAGFRKSIILTIFLLSGINLFSQTKVVFPTVGKTMPDFVLDDLNYHAKTKISSTDLKGKWYVLDFWIMGYKPCIESFPKVSKMIKEFKGRAEILLECSFADLNVLKRAEQERTGFD